MWLSAASAPPALNEVVIAISGVLVAVVTAIAGVAVAIINSRKAITPAADETTGQHTAEDVGFLRERVAVLERRAGDSDERDEVQDRRLDQLERAADLDNPHWRHPEA